MTGRTWALTQIQSAVDPEKEVLVTDEDYAYIMNKETQRMKMLFKKAGHRYTRVDLEKAIEFIAATLKPTFDVEKFLKELLALRSSPHEIMELHNRLLKPSVSIKAHKDCYTLSIGGEIGRPYDFVVVV